VQLTDEHRSNIIRFLRYRGVREDDVEDLTQKTLLQAWEHRRQFKGDSILNTWLISIAKNEMLMAVRKNKREEGSPIESEPFCLSTAYQNVLTSERRAFVYSRMQLLSPLKQQALLSYLCGDTIEEIIAEVGCSQSAMKSRRKRAMEELFVRCGAKFVGGKL